MEKYSIEKSFVELLKDMEDTQHEELNDEYGIDVTIKEHIVSIIDKFYHGYDIVRGRFCLYDNQNSYKGRDEIENNITTAIILHDIVNLPDFEGDDHTNIEKINEIIVKYFGEEFKKHISNYVLKIVYNAHLNLNDREAVEYFFNSNDSEFNKMFLTFMVTHDIGTMSLIPEFKKEVDYNMDGEKKKIIDEKLIDSVIMLKYKDIFDIIDTLESQKAQDDDKMFTAKIITLNKQYNDQIKIPQTVKELPLSINALPQSVQEMISSGDVGGGVHPVGDARHSNLFNDNIRRHDMFKKRKNKNRKKNKEEESLFDKVLKRKMKSDKAEIFNSDTFSITK